MFFHIPQLLLIGVLSLITGFGGIDNINNDYIWVAFVLSIIATSISIIRTSFKFQKTSSIYHSASGQYSDIKKDLTTKLKLGFSDLDDIEETQRLYNEKVKFINSYAPHFSRFA